MLSPDVLLVFSYTLLLRFNLRQINLCVLSSSKFPPGFSLLILLASLQLALLKVSSDSCPSTPCPPVLVQSPNVPQSTLVSTWDHVQLFLNSHNLLGPRTPPFSPLLLHCSPSPNSRLSHSVCDSACTWVLYII